MVAVVLLEAIVLHVVQVARHVPVHLLRGDHSARKQDLLIEIGKIIKRGALVYQSHSVEHSRKFHCCNTTVAKMVLQI